MSFLPRGHMLVFGDDQTSFPRLQRPVAYVQDAGLVADQPVVNASACASTPMQPGYPARLRLRATRVADAGRPWPAARRSNRT